MAQVVVNQHWVSVLLVYIVNLRPGVLGLVSATRPTFPFTPSPPNDNRKRLTMSACHFLVTWGGIKMLSQRCR